MHQLESLKTVLWHLLSPSLPPSLSFARSLAVYRPILSKLLSFSADDEAVVRDSFGEKETYTFRLW